MKIGIIADAHGNIEGLNTCLKFFSKHGVQEIIFLGDAIGYMPESNEVIKALSNVHAKCLLGNHEAMFLGILELEDGMDTIYRIKDLSKVHDNTHWQRIASFLPYYLTTSSNKRILFVHGNPWDPLRGYIYPDTNINGFDLLGFDIIFMGHTHYPFIKKIKNVLVVNVGSCGLPRDQGNLACCVLYDNETNQCEIIRLYFNEQKIIAQYGNRIHSSIRNCLLRKCNKSVVGQIINTD